MAGDVYVMYDVTMYQSDKEMFFCFLFLGTIQLVLAFCGTQVTVLISIYKAKCKVALDMR